MRRFEEGKTYQAYDTGVPEITVLKRTTKMVLVKNDASIWRMRIREDNDGEYVVDSSVPDAWRDCYTYHAKFEVK